MASEIIPSYPAAGSLEGTPRGSQTKVGPLDTYVAQPPVQKDNSSAVVVFYDEFGFKIPNAKLISDLLAEKTGLTVYCPDIFAGDGVSPEDHSVIAIKDQRNIIKKLSESLEHHPKAHTAQILEFLTALKREHSQLAAVGYGCGAKHAVHFISSQTVQFKAAVVCHPSHVSFDDITQITEAVSFVWAEHDHVFDKTARESVNQFLVIDQQMNNAGGYTRDNFNAMVSSMAPQGPRPPVALSKGFEAQLVVYPGTVHGFAIRPDLRDPETRKAFDGALDQAAAFVTKHLQVKH
ncbi:hypothetical protein PUNSTDRAFT_143266 [Punctularia strigosozonata HHB-11173 SS5]|uniref:uncharacterized protein n=1 Tax=Punctularia strigosozonata (strain HHB-11173) TaxID=741275 RepID=UPI000441699D|nr:uncharacterized protein PUNSTDRAFT_143266 [Punctularia strigosozonata HHB-11173 SS5]EIN09847.1 hypothetical protein PUNSTDRAFT_143266 [Punctularia strigosozonata HHB-11173 SS5]